MGRILLKCRCKIYNKNNKGIIYVVDSADSDNISESRKEFHKLLNYEELKNSVILIYANKQDKDEAMKVPEIISKYQLDKIKDHIWHIQGCSGKSGEGLLDGLQWLSDKIINVKENKFKNNPYLKSKNIKIEDDYTNPNKANDISKLDNTSSNISYMSNRSSQKASSIITKESVEVGKHQSKTDNGDDLKIEI